MFSDAFKHFSLSFQISTVFSFFRCSSCSWINPNAPIAAATNITLLTVSLEQTDTNRRKVVDVSP